MFNTLMSTIAVISIVLSIFLNINDNNIHAATGWSVALIWCTLYFIERHRHA